MKINTMKRLMVIALAVLLFSGSLALAGQKKTKIDKMKFPPLNEIKRPEIIKGNTANGIQLRVIKSEKLPIIDLRIMIKGGTVYDPPSKVGLAGLTARLIRIGGTTQLKPAQVDKLLDSKGITIAVGAREDYFTVTLSCLTENFDEGVSILAKLLLNPAFDPEKLEEAKGQLSSGIARRNDDAMGIVGREFDRLIYGKNSPFAMVQEYEHLDNIIRADLLKTYKMYFAPGNMLAGVTGPVEIEQVKAVFEKYLGNWAHQAVIPGYPQVQERTHDFKVAFAQKSSLNQSYLSIGHLGIKTDLSKSARFRVFNSIFSAGMSSRLSIRIRVKMGLTYGIGGGIGTRYLYPGATEFNTFTKSESTNKAIKAMLDEIDIIRKEKVSETELKDAKEALLNAYVFEFSTPDKVLRNSLGREFYDVDPDIADKLMEDVKKVTADDILEIAQNYLHPEKLVILVVGNKEKLDGDLSQLGKVKDLDISIKPPALKEKILPATPETLEKGSQLIMNLAKKQYKGYKGLKSLENVSSMTMTMQGRTLEMGLKTTLLFPGKSHVEISVMGMKMYRIVNGKKGIMNQMGQIKPMPEEEIEKGKFGGLYDIFHSKDKYKFQYLSEKEIEGKKYDVLYLFDTQKNWVKLFINKETGLIEIDEKVSKLPGQSGVARTAKSDFRTINGIPFAFKSVTTINGKKVAETAVKDIKVNPKVDPAIFKIEEKK